MFNLKNAYLEKHQEFIVAVKAQSLQGLTSYVRHSDFQELVDYLEPHVTIAQRHGLETNESYLQLLPYVYFYRDTDTGRQYYVYQRTKTVGETRLSGKLSIGIGGHVELTDIFAAVAKTQGDLTKIPLGKVLEESVIRELSEETDIKRIYYSVAKDEFQDPRTTIKEAFKGFIIDHGDAVGRVHIGLIFGVDLKDFTVMDDFNITDADLLKVGFKPIEEIELDKCERWTQIIFEDIKGNSETVPA